MHTRVIIDMFIQILANNRNSKPEKFEVRDTEISSW